MYIMVFFIVISLGFRVMISLGVVGVNFFSLVCFLYREIYLGFFYGFRMFLV